MTNYKWDKLNDNMTNYKWDKLNDNMTNYKWDKINDNMTNYNWDKINDNMTNYKWDKVKLKRSNKPTNKIPTIILSLSKIFLTRSWNITGNTVGQKLITIPAHCISLTMLSECVFVATAVERKFSTASRVLFWTITKFLRSSNKTYFDSSAKHVDLPIAGSLLDQNGSCANEQELSDGHSLYSLYSLIW